MISDDTRAGRRYHHNGDFSGEVHIMMAEDEVEHDSFAGETFVTVRIPMEDLRDIVTAAMRGEALDAIEQADQIQITVIRRGGR